jgi:S-DNA-T family DNA segregation ATPase FtsK/SpoIIIE
LGGDKDKPATPKGSSGGGMLGGIKGKLPFGGKQDKPGSRPGGPGSPGAPAGRSQGQFGGQFGSGAGAKTSTGTFQSAKTSTGTHAAAKGSSSKQGGLGRLFAAIPFVGAKAGADKKAAKPRTSKAPQVQGEGMSLDTKLDILGVGLVLGSVALVLGALSPTRGALLEQIYSILSQWFGWAAVIVPVTMLIIGAWLLKRHFGDEAPVIDKTQLLGKVMLFIGALVLFQYVDTFINPQFGDYSALSPDLLKEFLTTFTVNEGRGGGIIGAEIYFQLYTNFGEIAGFIVLLAWTVVSIMLALEMSAAEIAIVIASIGRSFLDSQRRRSQARAAQLAEQQAALPQVTVAKPEVEQLPGGTSPALPAPSPATSAPQPVAQPGLTMPARNIPVTMGGRTIGTFTGGELVPAEATAEAAASPAGTPPKPAPVPPAAGGFASRLRQSMPSVGLPGAASKTTAEGTPPPAAAKPGGLGGRLFGKRSADPEKPAASAPGMIEDEQAPAPRDGGTPTPDKQAAEPGKPATTGGFGGRLFGKRPGEPEKPTVTTTTGDGDKAPATLPDSKETFEPEKPAGMAAAATTAALIGSASEKPPVAPSPAAAKPPASNSPFAPKPSPMKLPMDDDEPDEFDDDFEDEDDEAPVRLGDLVRPSPAAPTASPFARPPTAKPAVPGATTPMGEPPQRSPMPVSSKPLGVPQPASEVAKAPVEPPKTEEDDELESLANLPPARPKGIGTSPPPPGGPTPPTAKPSLGDRQDRLNAIRGGQFGKSEPPPKVDTPPVKPADDEEAESKPATPMRPAATLAGATLAASAAKEQPERRLPVFGKLPEDRVEKKEDDKPAAFIPTPTPAAPSPSLKTSPVFNAPSNEPPVRAAVRPAQSPMPPRKPKDWKLPDYKTLLMPGSEQDFDREFLLRRARVIEDTLSSFGAPGRVVEVNTGPVITQFGVEPDYLVTRSGKKNRVKVSAIAQLDKDLQLALGAKSIRIEAPVPGKGYVGVEVPNEEAALVSLRDVMDSNEFQSIDSPLTIALGQSVDGTPVAANLDSMPHLLIAGTTGSGKSVCVNAVISSLLLRNTPDKLKMIMIDPKRVELTGYNGIPHLVAPVVVDLERIVGVLKWVTREMDERYKRFSNAGARNIEDFNKHLPAGEEWMPYVIVIIDELADLMMLAPDETERVITRIAALARATGIHLVIATQRPSVDVVTGLIKANFPARIAFAVAGGVDSRVILDQPGAERLLGRGDMLYMSGDSPAPVRLQGVFVSDVEINNITRYWKSLVDDDSPMRPIPMVLDSSVPTEAPRAVLPEEKRTQQAFWERDGASAGRNGDSDDDDVPEGEDEMYDEAVELVRRLGKASVSLLQRRLRIGYTRAARLIDVMEERGVVGPAESGSKPREVLPVED